MQSLILQIAIIMHATDASFAPFSKEEEEEGSWGLTGGG